MALAETLALAAIVVSIAYSDVLAMIHTKHDFVVLLLAFVALYALSGG